MGNLVSPGVSVTVIDQSFYVAGQQTTLPLIFIATADEKLQADGITPALGTYEFGIVRTVTSIAQSLELYGIPTYYYAADGTPYHGDCRNEYGLDGLNKFLELGNEAYVVRGNVNLNDNYTSIKTMWTANIAEAATTLSELVDEYIAAYNQTNQLIPADMDYKETVTKSELIDLINEAMADTFAKYSFSTDIFSVDFLTDHTITQAGYQDVIFTTSGGFLQLSDATGLIADNSYSTTIHIVDGSGAHNITVTLVGSDAVTFGDLIDELNSALGVHGTAEMIAGRIRITSALSGVSSMVDITGDGDSGDHPLFASLYLYIQRADPISGAGADPLVIYNNAYDTEVGTYDGVNGVISVWTSGSIVTTEFTDSEAASLLIAAAADFDNTREFLNDTSLGANDAARRAEIVIALAAQINSGTNGITAENLEYNVVACPGYPEVVSAMEALSQQMLDEVFVIGETPFDKPPDGPNGITNWAVTPARVNSSSVAYYYGHGISTNIDGRTILTTASSTALRVFAYNDLNADVWWAPAGPNRGTCPDLTDIGYVSGALGGPTTFVEEFLDLGHRNELYAFPININPITYIPGRGILVMGQKTSSPVTSSLDRINVSRLVMFIKRELRKAMFSFLFEPNDSITWAAMTFTANGFLGGLMGRRALYDFAVACNAQTTTASDIDANQTNMQIALKTIRDIEFIYIPITLVNTGANIGTGK